MNRSSTTINTSVEGIRDAVVRAGFRPGRQVEVTVKYTDAKEAREAEFARLSAILDRYPLPKEWEGMSEEQALALADEVIAEYRADRRNAGK